MAQLKRYNGSSWETVGGVVTGDTLPIGSEIEYNGASVPAGWQEIFDYSTSEIDTGKKWIDGNTIYRKVIQTTSPSSTNSWTVIGSISNLDTIINLYGWVYASNKRILPIQFSEPGAEIATTVLNGNIEMKVILSNWQNADCCMVAEYTKTS